MYRLPPSDFTLSDIERFCALMLRRGSTLASLRRHQEDDERVVLGAWVLGLGNAGDTLDEQVCQAEASRFLRDEGAWLAERPDVLMERADAIGLMERVTEAGQGMWRVRQPHPSNVNRLRLIDEMESAQAILMERRRRVRETLQAQNRAVNAPPSLKVDSETDQQFMSLALEVAQQAQARGEVPIGAVLVRHGEVLAQAGNATRTEGDPTAHAEMLVLRQGAQALGNYRMNDATLYVTLEPCPMCAGAIKEARVGRVVFALPDPKAGAMGGAFDLFGIAGMNHHPEVHQGCLAEASQGLLTRFFASRRTPKAAEDNEC